MQAKGASSDSNREDLKSHFMTREGLYRMLTHSEYSRPPRVQYTGPSTPVKVSFIQLSRQKSQSAYIGDRICFNYGRELYYYQYKGVLKVFTHSYTQFTCYFYVIFMIDTLFFKGKFRLLTFTCNSGR